MAATAATPLRTTLLCSNYLRKRPIAPPHPTTTTTTLSQGFTTSPTRRKHGPISTFAPTSSTELDTLLSLFRSQVFMPAHLPNRQKALIYKRKYQAMLENEPVYVELGGGTERESVLLSHINRTRDEPNTRQGVAKMLELMKTPGDWENLPLLLAEWKIAGRKHGRSLPPVEKWVRRANEAGMQGVVVECVKQVARTGLCLTEVRVVREVMWGAHLRGHQHERGWEDERITGKALAHAENVERLMEGPLHAGGLEEGMEMVDPRTQPDVVGVLLETAAIKALKHQDGLDGDRKVARYAERLMGCWRNADAVGSPEDAVASAEDAVRGKERRVWAAANYELQRWAPVWKGMEIAARIVDPKTEVAEWLKSTLPGVENVLKKNCEVVESSLGRKTGVKRRGLDWYHGLRKI
ncbi:MAG: hypothetical protein M1816_000321 [Peltula sp. TS41687]|nr:MAG: hypothetical protein M1816_000321 [Peltula sp. TS41687]